ncbi:WD40 repeat-like protein [Marasmius fiardii PR-910]|nr:WD40 repeat-like protein [Marasmius fiardii PR-910]
MTLRVPAGWFPEHIEVITDCPPEFKEEGSDWFAIFNPKIENGLAVNLVHILMHESVVCCVQFSPDGKYLATGCNRTAQIYDVRTGIKTCVLNDETAIRTGDLYLRSVCFSPDGKYLATAADDKRIRIWDIAKKQIINFFDGHQQEVYSLDFSPDGRLLASGSGDGSVRIWDLTQMGGAPKIFAIRELNAFDKDDGVTSVAISPNGQYVAAASLDTVVRIWDMNTGQLVEQLRDHRDSVYSVAFTPDGKGLVSGSLDKTAKLWDLSDLSSGSTNGPGASAPRDESEQSRCTRTFTGHHDFVLSAAVSPGGEWVVSGSKDRTVQFSDLQQGTVHCVINGHKNSVISVNLSPAGGMLATGSGDCQARISQFASQGATQ